MTLVSSLYLFLLPGVAHAFVGGWSSLSQSTLHDRPTVASSSAIARFVPDSTRVTATSSVSSWRAATRELRAQPNEYEVFFNKASKSGGAVIRGLNAEERAKRALEGEKIEDEIIEIATVLREKADLMVAETGSINFEVIQPMIDQISVLKTKYKLVVGAIKPEDVHGGKKDGEEGEEDNPS